MKHRAAWIVITATFLALALILLIAYEIRYISILRANPESITPPMIATRIDNRIELHGYTKAPANEISALVLFQGKVPSKNSPNIYLVNHLTDQDIVFEKDAGNELKLHLLSVFRSPIAQLQHSTDNPKLSQDFTIRQEGDKVVINILLQKEQDINSEKLSLGIVHYAHGVGYLYLLPVD